MFDLLSRISNTFAIIMTKFTMTEASIEASSSRVFREGPNAIRYSSIKHLRGSGLHNLNATARAEADQKLTVQGLP